MDLEKQCFICSKRDFKKNPLLDHRTLGVKWCTSCKEDYDNGLIGNEEIFDCCTSLIDHTVEDNSDWAD